MPDGCSGGVSILWRVGTGHAPQFEFCCNEHDVFYEQGGSEADRRFADRLLRECMSRDGHPVLARIFYAAVTLFGWRHWNYTHDSEVIHHA